MIALRVDWDDRGVVGALALALRKIDPGVDAALVEAGGLIKEEAAKRVKGPYSRETSEPGGEGRARKPLEERGKVKPLRRRVIVAFSAPYANVQNWGGTLRPHVIRPRKAAALLFAGNYAASVQHPGARIKGKHFLDGAAMDARGQTRLLVDEAVKRALERGGVSVR